MRLCRYALPPTGQIGFLNFSLPLLAEYRGVWLVATPFCFALSRRCRLSPIGKQPFLLVYFNGKTLAILLRLSVLFVLWGCEALSVPFFPFKGTKYCAVPR